MDSTNKPNGLTRAPLLDLPVLERALDLLLGRHSVLNCYIQTRDDQPWLTPCAPSKLDLTLLSFDNPDDREAAEGAVSDLVWGPLDVWNGPLYRAYAVKLGAECYIGLVSHHFVSDAHSIQILMNELGHIYGALLRGRQPALPPVGLRYQDYLHAINEWIESQAGQRMRAATFDRLKQISGTDFGDRLDYDNVEEDRFQFDREVSENVRRAARALGVSPFMILLAVQKKFLHAFSSSDHVTIKIITTGRELTPLMQTVGNMADRLYVMTDLSGDPSFAEIISRTQKSLSWSRKHAFVRDDFVQTDLSENGVSPAAPVINFRTVPANAADAAAASHIPISRSFRVLPPPGSVSTRPRDAYYMMLMDNGADFWGSVRYGQGRIRNFLQDYEDLLAEGCQAILSMRK